MNAQYRLAFAAKCDFRKSEKTNLMLAETIHEPLMNGEVFMFLSGSMNQIIFILGTNRHGTGVIDSRRWRLDEPKLKWTAKDVKAFAKHVGINLVNFDRFAKHLFDFE